MIEVEPVFAAYLRPGDVITEVDTPTGPWYTVLDVAASRVIISGGAACADEPLPVTLPVKARDLVLRRNPC